MRLRLTVAGLVVSLALGVGAQTVRPPLTPPGTPVAPSARPAPPALNLDTVRAWIAAATAHEPGEADEAVKTIASWSEPQLTGVIHHTLELVKLLSALASRERPARYDRNHTFTADSLRELFGLDDNAAGLREASEVLQRGALLHTDIAILGGPIQATSVSGTSISLRVFDGQVLSNEGTPIHWSVARRLLDGLAQQPAHAGMVRLWYRATSACQSSRLRWVDAVPHLERARQLFPDDGRFLFYSGVIHEVFAMPASQAVRQEQALIHAAHLRVASRADRVTTALDVAPVELRRAADFLRRALARAPDLAEARLRLGRVLGLLGQRQEAERELTDALAALEDPVLVYYAALFRGEVRARLQRFDEARADFERAAALFPAAQAPILARSHLSRVAGDETGAQAIFERLLALPADPFRRVDPWWGYDRAHVRDADALLEEVRRPFRTGGGR